MHIQPYCYPNKSHVSPLFKSMLSLLSVALHVCIKRDMRKKNALLVQLKHFCTYLYCTNGQTISSQFLSILKPDGEFLTAGVYISSLEIVIWVWWFLFLLWYYDLNDYTPLSPTGTLRHNEIMKTPPLLRNLKGAQSSVQSVCSSTSSHTRVQHSSPGVRLITEAERHSTWQANMVLMVHPNLWDWERVTSYSL